MSPVRLLTTAQLQVDLRDPRTGQPGSGRIGMTLLAYGFSGLVLALSLGDASPEQAVFVAASFGVVLAAFGVVGSYDELMGRPKENAWLSTLPASERQHYAARLLGIAAYVGLMAVSVAVPVGVRTGLVHGVASGLQVGGLVAAGVVWTAGVSLAVLWAISLALLSAHREAYAVGRADGPHRHAGAGLPVDRRRAGGGGSAVVACGVARRRDGRPFHARPGAPGRRCRRARRRFRSRLPSPLLPPARPHRGRNPLGGGKRTWAKHPDVAGAARRPWGARPRRLWLRPGGHHTRPHRTGTAVARGASASRLRPLRVARGRSRKLVHPRPRERAGPARDAAAPLLARDLAVLCADARPDRPGLRPRPRLLDLRHTPRRTAATPPTRCAAGTRVPRVAPAARPPGSHPRAPDARSPRHRPRVFLVRHCHADDARLCPRAPLDAVLAAFRPVQCRRAIRTASGVRPGRRGGASDPDHLLHVARTCGDGLALSPRAQRDSGPAGSRPCEEAGGGSRPSGSRASADARGGSAPPGLWRAPCRSGGIPLTSGGPPEA